MSSTARIHPGSPFPRLAAAFVAAGLCVAAAAPAQGRFVSGVHEDPASGFKIRVPDRWKMVPVKIDEKWIAAKYICHREYTNKGKGYAVSHTPDMKVLVFTPDKLEREDRVESRGDTTYIGGSGRVFRNYEEFLREDMKAIGLGYHEVERGDDKLGDVPVTTLRYTAKTDYTSYAYLAWVYQRPDDQSTVAVQFTVLEDRFDTLWKDLEKAFKSFRFIDRTASADSDDLENPMWTKDRAKWRELALSERQKIRREIEEKRRQKYIDTAPEGWFTMNSKSGSYVALSHSDKKYTQRILAAADAMHSWMDKHFGDISDEYVMTGIVRICENWDEFTAYRDTSSRTDARSFSVDDREVVDYKDVDSGTSGGGLGLVAGGLMDNYLFDKDSLLYFYMPEWLDSSLRSYFAAAQLKGRKLAFKPSTQENIRIKEAEREEQIVTLQQIMTTPFDDWPRNDNDQYWRYRWQMVRAIRFMLDGPGKRHKLLKDFIPRYMKATITAAEEWREQQRGVRQAETVEEEEQRARERAEQGKKRRRFVLDKVTAECCTFSDKEWDQLNKLFARYLTN